MANNRSLPIVQAQICTGILSESDSCTDHPVGRANSIRFARKTFLFKVFEVRHTLSIRLPCKIDYTLP